MTIKDQVIEIVADKLGVDKEEITMTKSFIEDLNADSLDLTELIMAFEEVFECDISEQEASNMRTVGDAVAYIEKTCG